ncbi:MAG: HNH endonuclease [Nanoarchaeota archaeon]|nr:HNH endonuclease [Nanoarchaeota archaeon]
MMITQAKPFVEKIFGKEARKRKGFSTTIISKAFDKQKHKCLVCKTKFTKFDITKKYYTVHHKVGKTSINTLANCEILCLKCNRKKREKRIGKK